MGDAVPSPKAILRGHKAQIHSATFIRGNERLITGDAEGYVVSWDLTIMRPRAVWRAHEKAILGIMGWGSEKIITHGRDHKLVVWKVGNAEEDTLSKQLPVEDVPMPRTQPWLLHLLEVNTMNFCAFAACPSASSQASTIDNAEEIFVAVPNTLASEAIDIYRLPSQERIHTIRPGEKNGMVMSLALFHREHTLVLVAAFENGYATVHRLQDWQWIMTYRSQPHSQPILSLDVHFGHEYFITSSADSIIAKHPIPLNRQETIGQPLGNERVIDVTDAQPNQAPSLLSASLNASSSGGGPSASRTLREWRDPLKVVNTKHSGQQSLKIRSDGRIVATAGWDSRVRVYSCKSLKELAVLKWHGVGCYAVAFSDIPSANENDEAVQDNTSIKESIDSSSSPSDREVASTRGLRAMVAKNTSVKDRRIAQAKSTHWIAAGAKDGKISLWDIY